MRRPAGTEPTVSTNLSLPARVRRAAEMLAREDGESLTGMFAQYIRARLKKRGLTLADSRFDPPKEQGK